MPFLGIEFAIHPPDLILCRDGTSQEHEPRARAQPPGLRAYLSYLVGRRPTINRISSDNGHTKRPIPKLLLEASDLSAPCHPIKAHARPAYHTWINTLCAKHTRRFGCLQLRVSCSTSSAHRIIGSLVDATKDPFLPPQMDRWGTCMSQPHTWDVELNGFQRT